MHIHDEEAEKTIERSIKCVLGSEGYSVYFVHPETHETKLMLHRATESQADAYCRWLRNYIAAIVREIAG